MASPIIHPNFLRDSERALWQAAYAAAYVAGPRPNAAAVADAALRDFRLLCRNRMRQDGL